MNQKASQREAPLLAIGEALRHADRLRREGRLTEAEAICREILGVQPEAEHLLGIIAHQGGKLGEALVRVQRATQLAPQVALFHANLGEICRLAGRLDEAIAAGRRALEINSDYPGALNNLGNALFDQGKFEDALTHYDRAIALQGDFALAHSSRGNALQRLKRFAEAEGAYRRAIALQPGSAEAWNNLGTCLRELKRLEEAETVYRKAIELSSNSAARLARLALAAKHEAASLARRALALAHRRDKFHVYYASVLLDQKKIDEAALAVEQALALDPNNHDAVHLMGCVAFERGDLDAALTSFRRALTLKPDLVDAYNNMGNALKDLGRLREARDAYLEALRLDPSDTSVYLNLADLKKFAPGDPHLAALEALAAKREGLSPTDRMQLDFVLGKAYADVKDYSRSFRHLVAGNAAKRATISYDEMAACNLFDRIEAVFTPELIAKKSGGGDPSKMPIFVIGMPRSGTTLVEQIIASHPMVVGAGELQTFNDVVLAMRGADNNVTYPDFISALDASAVQRIGAAYVAAVRKLSPRGDYVTDKRPSNYYFAGLIRLALPNAKIVHTMRDPIDTCVSCFSRLFSSKQNHTYDLGELGRHYKRYERLMAHWRQVLPAGSILDVHYEDVVADLEAQARRIIAYCGLPWHDNCVAFHKTDRPVRTASATQVREPIYNNAIGRWRAYADHLQPLLTALGIA